MLKRYHERKSQAIIYLGGQCVECQSRDDLQFDHKDRLTKGFTIAKLWSVNEQRFWEEIKKCQLLCLKCHIIKSALEQGKKPARGTHGTLSSYRYCRCDKCKRAKSEYMKDYFRTHNSEEESSPFKRKVGVS